MVLLVLLALLLLMLVLEVLVCAGDVGRCQFVRWMFVVLDSMVVSMVL